MYTSPDIQPKTRKRGFTLVEMLVVVAIIGLLAALLLPALSRAKVKALRVKCLNNLSTIGKALTGYGNDFDDRMPWQILNVQQASQLGGNHWSDLQMSPAAIFSMPTMVKEIGDAKVLLSPCDPERKPFNEQAEEMWSELDLGKGIIIPERAISYVLIEGGDIGRPTTVLALTRNVSHCDLKKARWVGADEDNLSDAPMAMARMMKGQGQLVMADGSSHLSDDADLGEEGVIIKAHIKSDGGNSVKLASTLAIGCTGVFVEKPIGEVFNTWVGDNHVFIIDKSGSMRRADKMNRAKNALLDALYKMRPTKKFYVYFFNWGAAKMQFNDGTECEESLFAYQYKVDLVSEWIKEQSAGGGTNPSEALKDAFTTKEPEVIWLLTDGYFGTGSAHIRRLITQLNTDRLVRVNTVGFGPSPSRVDPGLQAIADENSGTYYFAPIDK